MSQVESSVALLRIGGDELHPPEITDLLGIEPTSAQIKGERIMFSRDGRFRIAKTGMWRLEVADRHPGDPEAQVLELMELVSADLGVWRQITSRFEADVSFGLFMRTSNDFVALGAGTLLVLGQRGIRLSVELYDPATE